MRIKCKNDCDAFFSCKLEVVVEHDGSFYETHLRHFRMDSSELSKWVFCSECGEQAIIE